MNYPKPHHNHVSEYQVSGIPFVTASAYNEVEEGSAICVKFPYVTQWVQVASYGYGGLQVGFTENGVLSKETANYFIVSSGSISTSASAAAVNTEPTQKLNVRCKEIWITGMTSNSNQKAGFVVLASLTNVQSRDFPTLTGSAGFEGVG